MTNTNKHTRLKRTLAAMCENMVKSLKNYRGAVVCNSTSDDVYEARCVLLERSDAIAERLAGVTRFRGREQKLVAAYLAVTDDMQSWIHEIAAAETDE